MDMDMELEKLLLRTADVTLSGAPCGAWQPGTAVLGGRSFPCCAKDGGRQPVVAYRRQGDGTAVLACGGGRPILPELPQAEDGAAWVCQYEHSCGALLFTERGGQRLYLVIEGTGGHIGFPKGHMEKNERIPDTVARELREEVGVTDFTYIEGYEVHAHVITRKNRQKEVSYYLASFDPERNTLCRQEEEVAAFWLLPYKEAREKVNTALDRELLDRAEQLLETPPPKA